MSLPKVAYQPSHFSGELALKNHTLQVSGEDFEVIFKNGILCSYNCHGKKLLDQPFTFNLYRAPTDNDGILGIPNTYFHRNALKWNLACLDTIHFAPLEMTSEISTHMAVCRVKGKILPLAKYYGFDAEIEYRIYNDGLISINIKAFPYGNFPENLPRIGLCFPIDKKYQSVTWYGRGERENYSDCKKASPVGLYSKPVHEAYTVFDMPQESGNHEDTSFVMLNDSYTNGLTVIGCNQFAFSYHDFTLSSLTRATHKNELEKGDCNYLYIDYKMRGLGSHSCGPEPEEDFELRPHAFEFSFVLTGNISQDEALNLTRSDFGTSTQVLNTMDIFQSLSIEQNITLL